MEAAPEQPFERDFLHLPEWSWLCVGILTVAACANRWAISILGWVASLAVERRMTFGESLANAIAILSKSDVYDKTFLSSLTDFQSEGRSEVIRAINLAELTAGMVLDEDVLAKNNLVVVRENCEVTQPMIERLRNFERSTGIIQPFRVRVVAHP